MKKIALTTILSLAGAGFAFSQSAIDAYRLSQPDLKGTARFMSMAGAFGALGGDLSSISYNPAGIGVYRSSDIGFTLDLDLQDATSEAFGFKQGKDQTKFLLNNIGAVFTLKLPNETCPNFNFGFTYNKGVSFNRVYQGNISRLNNSLSNYIAGIANYNELTVGDVTTTSNYDPYNPGYNDYVSPWIAILGYDGYLINPIESKNNTEWYGQWGEGTSGDGSFLVEEKGGLNEYNISFGGNIKDVLFWGMNFDIINLNYSLNALWSENLNNAYLLDRNNNFVQQSARWDLDNIYNVTGTGFNYQIGVIFKPIQELRLGVAFHTPTWYKLTESYGANLTYSYNGGKRTTISTNDGVYGYNDVDFRSPMKLIASAAGVIGSNFIISFDYEWVPYNKMKYSVPTSYGYSGWYDDPWDWSYPYWKPESPSTKAFPSSTNSYDPYAQTNNDIATYYQHTNTFRIGAEFRITPFFSLRAGYSTVSSPVKSEVKNDNVEIATSGTLPNYRFDNETNYITGGLGWRYDHFYMDLAYVYKHMSSTYHAYTPDPSSDIHSPQSKLSFSNNQIVLTAGFRF